MASGWAKEGAVQDQIDSDILDAVTRARLQLHQGDSMAYCEICDEPIPVARQLAVPGVRLCIQCQQEQDKLQQRAVSFNRRGSKDSQLR